MTPKSILVTGGAGFLGSHLCERLLAQGHRVICLDNLESGQRQNVARFEDDEYFTFVKGDVRDLPKLPDADQVYHMASRASPADFTEYPVQIALTNTTGTRNMLEYCMERDATLVFASTSEVYGDPEVHPQVETYSGNVNIRGVRGCYDESKRFGETLTVAYGKKHGVDARTARIFNTYGPRMRPDDGRVVPTFLRQALAGDPLTIYGDGTQTRSFCFVSDLVEGLISLMNTSGLDGEAVNLGRENERTIEQLAEAVIDVCDVDSEILYEPLPEDDPRRRKPDINKAREHLGWEPEIPLEEGLKRTRDYFRDLPNS